MNQFSIGIDLGGTRIKLGLLKNDVIIEKKNFDAESAKGVQANLPKIEIVLIDRKDLPSSGAGEAAIIGIAPAIRNAIVNATGKALNTLPMLPGGKLG